jgi:hypothetical protein
MRKSVKKFDMDIDRVTPEAENDYNPTSASRSPISRSGVPMRTALFLVSLAAAIALPAFAQLGPAGVPGAPGLAPPPPESTQPAAPPPPEGRHGTPPPKVPAACANAKNVERCVARQELRRKAHAVCKKQAGEAYRRCVNDYMNRRRK